MRKIVVVGAGLAGLTAAYRLQKSGFDVDVYEARGRAGGRVCTAYFGKSHEELGGKNLHDGGVGKNIRSLIKEMDLSLHNYTIHLSKGIFRYKSISYSLERLLIDGPVPTEELHKILLSKVGAGVSLADIINPLFLNSPPLRAFIELFTRGYMGLSSNLVSAEYLDIGFWSHYKELYEAVRNAQSHEFMVEEVKGGNSLLIEALTHALAKRIHYNRALREIGGDEGHLKLKFDQDLLVEASHVILAIPDSTLRDVKIKKGSIPEDQWLAIQKRNYGTNAKILIPCYGHTSNSSIFHCLEECSIWFDEQGDIATCYYGGTYGDFRKDRVDAIFERSYEQLQELIPKLSVKKIQLCPMKEELIAHYQGPIYVSWICEEFSKGSYSNFTPSCADMFNRLANYMGEQIRYVYRPVNNRLFFAGEQTAVNHSSTMEGAVESGEVAARFIKKAMNGTSDRLSKEQG